MITPPPSLPREVALSYTLTFQAPFHCGTGRQAGLLDRTIQRDREGRLLVPGSTLKGVLRQSCEGIVALWEQSRLSLAGPQQLAPHHLRVSSPHDDAAAWQDLGDPPSLLACLFGTRARPGTLYYDDATLSAAGRLANRVGGSPAEQHAWQVDQRAQVSLGRATRTARPQALYTSEYGLAHLSFKGSITGMLEGPDQALSLLAAGLRAVTHVGAQRSTGVGRCQIIVETLTVTGMPPEESAAYRDLLRPPFLADADPGSAHA